VDRLNHEHRNHESEIPAHNSSTKAGFSPSFEEVEWQHKARQYEENGDPQLAMPKSLDRGQHGPKRWLRLFNPSISLLLSLIERLRPEGLNVEDIDSESPYTSQAVHMLIIN
jgi:hypothetical protein